MSGTLTFFLTFSLISAPNAVPGTQVTTIANATTIVRSRFPSSFIFSFIFYSLSSCFFFSLLFFIRLVLFSVAFFFYNLFLLLLHFLSDYFPVKDFFPVFLFSLSKLSASILNWSGQLSVSLTKLFTLHISYSFFISNLFFRTRGYCLSTFSFHFLIICQILFVFNPISLFFLPLLIRIITTLFLY